MFNRFFLSQRRLILGVLTLFVLLGTLQFLHSRKVIQPRLLSGSGAVLEPERLGLAYLENLRKSRAQYCSPASPSQLMCFHSQTAPEGRIDSFCVGQNAVFNPSLRKFQLSCERIDPRGVESNQSAPALDDFPMYWYHTGPRQVFNDFVDLDAQVEHNKEIERITILVKREGAGNIWHSLMEIMSASMTLDVLQMTRSVGSLHPIISAEDSLKSQVVIVDSHTDGPYFDLWRILAKMPVVRLPDLSTDFNSSLVVVPLPGGSNPIWQADWEPTLCQHSDLLQTFAWRVRQQLNISDPVKLPDQVVVTIIERQGTRKLIDQHARIEALKKQYQASEVLIQLIDFAVLPLQEQVQIIRGTDVLVGVHGAGLTHGLWLPQRSAMVEILPEGFQHKGFRNLAGALGHDYFSTHASTLQTSSRGANDNSWQVSDVALDEERWLQLMNVAIKSMYNKGRHNFDTVK
ncbi:DUF563 domain protein [Talaromyces stipitatus ATCC 10500]|uniref:EGF domain-specific O-linked N-acetylglucosamine transferase n=1 Tax=Talaromyces stipitatus (strain ATCC 10500 / CBS 375.48 / QM 6759 / NRRL 1006) TaxID=441959 RepID=B8MJS9_TALSN|nr:DUF563 domain protein [Talaromyces stipitatus ATCC 10500]EED14746.1 DUF563 domain protein [Talaromyces stipitatus ATCC 10500]